MKLLLKQRVFSWLDSYDIYDEFGTLVFRVKGEFSVGHLLKIYDENDVEVGYIKERIMTFLPKFEFYHNDELVGEIQKEMTLFKPKFHLTFNDWEVNGDIWEWDYHVCSLEDNIMDVHKEVAFGDTYVLNIEKVENALFCVMIVLAIDAIKCN